MLDKGIDESTPFLSDDKRCFPSLYAGCPVFCIKTRYVFTFVIFLGLCNTFANRVNLSVAIVEMTAENPSHGQRYSRRVEHILLQMVTIAEVP